MNESEFEIRAKQHRNYVAMLTILSLILGFVCSSIAVWAEEFSSWQGSFVESLFYLMSGIFGLSFILFGAAFLEWYNKYPRAKKSLESMSKEQMELHYRSVIGPFPWS